MKEGKFFEKSPEAKDVERSQESVFPKGFELPDVLSGLEEERYIEKAVEVPMVFEGKELVGKVTVNASFVDSFDERNGHYFGQLFFETFDPEKDKHKVRLSSFKASLRFGDHDVKYRTKDNVPHKNWHIGVRRVEKAMRRQGFGEWNMKAIEELMYRLSKENEEFNATWVQFDTRLGSLSNLAIDPNWLEGKIKEISEGDVSEKLKNRAEKKELNLGYIPHPQDTDRALSLLQEETEELEDIQGSGHHVRFVKALDPNFDPSSDFKSK